MSGPSAEEPIDAEIVVPEAPPAPAPVVPDYDDRGVPSFDYVRDRIEGRGAVARGTTELTGDTPESRTLDEQMADRDEKAREKLADLRRSLGL